MSDCNIPARVGPVFWNLCFRILYHCRQERRSFKGAETNQVSVQCPESYFRAIPNFYSSTCLESVPVNSQMLPHVLERCGCLVIHGLRNSYFVTNTIMSLYNAPTSLLNLQRHLSCNLYFEPFSVCPNFLLSCLQTIYSYLTKLKVLFSLLPCHKKYLHILSILCTTITDKVFPSVLYCLRNIEIYHLHYRCQES